MIAQSTALLQPTPTEQSPTCSACPFFNDYNEARNRGYCQAFDQVTRRHHPCTVSCHQALEARRQKPSIPLMVLLMTKAVQDFDGHAVPVDEKIIDLTVSELSEDKVRTAISLRKDLRGYEIVSFWKPENEDEF